MSSKRWTHEQIGDQTGRIAVVTGANAGIGREDARQLAQHGATVILACRDAERGGQAADEIHGGEPAGSVEVMALDLADLTSVRGFALAIHAKFDRLDLLVNNAGVMMPPRSKTADGFELQFGTNHLGHFALTGQLLDLLLDTPESRVVTVASQAHRYAELDLDDLHWESRPYKDMPSYGQSKLANLLFTFELQRRLDAAGAGTIALAAHPGWTATDLQRHSGLFRWMNPFFAMKPWQGALPTLYAATADGVPGGEYYGPGGIYEMRGYPKAVDSSPLARDEDTARRLWEISEELTGVTFLAPSGEVHDPGRRGTRSRGARTPPDRAPADGEDGQGE